MSMHPDSENFEKLRRLLAVKRHEQPPPGYFYHFSDIVVARIKAGELGEDATLAARVGWEWSWLKRLWSSLETRPAFTAAFGLLVCGFFATGIVLSERGENDIVGSVVVPQTSAVVQNLPSENGLGSRSSLFQAPVSGSILAQGGLVSLVADTNQATSIQPARSLFNSIRPQATFINFSPSN